jgi:hypothetical protein
MALNEAVLRGANVIPLKVWSEVADFVTRLANMMSNAPYKEPLT